VRHGALRDLYAFEQEGIVPDLVTVAKGLGAGYQPIGATLVAKHVYDAIVSGSGFFQHGHTYLGHAAACAARSRCSAGCMRMGCSRVLPRWACFWSEGCARHSASTRT